MKTLIFAAIRCSLMFTAVAALSLAYPASVQAVPTTYMYTGNHFTDVSGPYTTSDFVTAMVTLASPLPPSAFTSVTPLAFSISDGVQTITNLNALGAGFHFTTDAAAHITLWLAFASTAPAFPQIGTGNSLPITAMDVGIDVFGHFGEVDDNPGVWRQVTAVPDTGSTISLMTLTLMALGLVARRFQRAAG